MPERSRFHPDDPAGRRHPSGVHLSDRLLTSHERMTGLTWDASYENGPAPWDIGRPQPAIVHLVSGGGFVAGPVLDVGCGTGENTLHIALHTASLG